METTHLILLGILFGAFFIGTVLGFGTTIMTLTFSAQMMPIEEILPIIAPLNLALAVYLAVRHREKIQWQPLLRRIGPAVGVGVPIGLMLFTLRDAQWLRLGFGVFVMVIASMQLRAAWATTPGDGAPLNRLPGTLLLGLGGVFHGLFNTGGPLLVYVLGRELTDKGEFRSTIAALFTVMTTVLIVSYYAAGLVTPTSVKVTLFGTIPVALGIVCGEIAHARLGPHSFKRVLWSLLCVGGVVLTINAAQGS